MVYGILGYGTKSVMPKGRAFCAMLREMPKQINKQAPETITNINNKNSRVASA